MTTNHHDPHAFGAPLTSAEVNRPLGQLDAAIAAAIVTGSGATTALTAQANSGQASLTVASSAGFSPGMSIWIGDPGGTFEVKTVNTVPNGTTITCTTNLANTYASGKPVSASPVELVDARGGQVSLGVRISLFDRWAYDVRKFGATGDGATDDKAAIQAAVDAATAAGGGVVFAPPGDYRLASTLSLKTGVRLAGAGEGTVFRIDHTGYGILALGTVVAGDNLAANATKGGVSVTVGAGAGAGYSAGQYVVIQSEAQAMGAVGHKKADIYRIRSVAGDVITIEGILLDTYLTADTAKIRKVTPVARVGVTDLQVLNVRWTTAPTTPTSALIGFEQAVDCLVRGVFAKQNNGHIISFHTVLNGRLEGSHIEDARDDTANGIFGYGTAVGYASRNISIVGNDYQRCRHGFTTDTSTATALPNYGVPRSVTFAGNTVADCTHFGIDTHEDGDGIAIVGNAVSGSTDGGGIQVRCWRVTVSGNTIQGCRGSAGVYIRPTAAQTLVEGNTVRGIWTAAGQGHGIWVDAPQSDVTGNHVTECYGHGIHVSANANAAVTIAGNLVTNNSQGSAGTFDGLNVDDNITRLNVVGNSFLDTQSVKTQRYGIRFEAQVDNATGQIMLADNDLANNLTGPFSNAGTAKPQVWGNMPASAPGHVQHVFLTNIVASIAAGAEQDVVVTFPYTMLDANYVVFVSPEHGTAPASTWSWLVKSRAASAVTLRVKNNDASARGFSASVLVVHD